MSRVCVLAAALMAALGFAAAAGATSAPPWFGIRATVRFLPPIVIPGETRRTASCAVPARQGSARVKRRYKKLAPVACEQPPRSKVSDAGSSIVLAP
ncbi:MAG TPA: hypothetical protein VGK79_14085 [Gaiellaceae bacterium]|jgi:hypothetical protein